MAANRSLGTLTLQLIAQIGGFTKPLDDAASKSQKTFDTIEKSAEAFSDQLKDVFANAFAGLGLVASLDKFVESVKESLNVMDEMSKSAQRVGLSTEAFSSLAFAAKLADVNTDALQGTLGKLIKNLAAAQDPASQQAKVFSALGISTKTASGQIRDSESVLKDFADRFKELDGSPEAIAAGMVIFGKSFQDIIPLLKDGADGISDAQAEAVKLNQVISTDNGKAAEEFNDNLTRLQSAVEGVYNAVAAKLLPQLENWSDETVALVEENGKLDDVATALYDGLQALGAIANVVAAGFKFITAAVQTTATAAAALVTIWKQTDNNNPFDQDMWKQVGQSVTNMNDQIKDIWANAAKGIDDSFDAAGNNIKRIQGQLVDLNKQQLQKGANNFIDSIFGTDQDADDKKAKLTKNLQDVFGNSDKYSKEAQKAADELAAAYAKLNDAVAKTTESLDPNQQAYAKYAETVRNIDQLGAEAIKKGGDVVYVQQQVAQAVDAAQKKLAQDLAAPMQAAQAYADALQSQLDAHKQLIQTQVDAIGMGTKEAANQQALAKVYQDGVKAISDYQKAYDESVAKGKPNATPDQYQAQLKSLQDYWSQYYQDTKDGQDAVDRQQANWMNGAISAWQNFFDEQSNAAKIAQGLTNDFFNDASSDLSDFISGTKSANDALKDFINNFEQQITQAVSKQLLKNLFNIGNDSGSSSGGWLSQLLSSFNNGGSSGSSSSVSDAIGQYGWANGGTVPAGAFGRVVERGPELLSVGGEDYLMMGSQTGRVTPNNQLTGGGVNVTNNFNLAAPTNPLTQSQIANKATYEQRRAARLS
jgi:lambda family phage tail tape measure protein